MKRNTKSSRPVDRSSVTSDNVVGGSRQKKPSRRLVETALSRRNLGRTSDSIMSAASQQLAQNLEESSARRPATPRSSPRIQRIGSADAQCSILARRRTTRSFGLPDRLTPRDEEDLVTSSESNIESRNDPVYDSSDAERDAAQDNDDDGASGIEAARVFLLRQETASTSVSRQASIIATSSKSSQTSMSSPEVQGPSLRRKTRSEDPLFEKVEHATKRQRTSLLGNRPAKYNSPYPAVQISATPEPTIEDGLEVRVLRSSSRSVASVAPVAIVKQASTGGIAIVESLAVKETTDPHFAIPHHASKAALQDFARNPHVESSISAHVIVEGPKNADTPRRTRRSTQARSKEPDSQSQEPPRIQQAQNLSGEADVPINEITTDTTSNNSPARAGLTLETNIPNFPIDLISKDIEDLVAETQQGIEKEENLRKMVDFTIHRLETLKNIRDDPSREFYSDKPWQDFLSAVGDYITTKDPIPDKMMTEWHQLMADIKLNFSKIEAMKKNLAKIVEENDDHIRKVKDRLDLHYQIRQGTNLGMET